MAVQLRNSRVGLALGAGGVLGGAWTVGGLAALAGETGWDPADASHVVGTSAGSVFSALVASGVPISKLMPVGEEALASLEDTSGWLLSELASEASYMPKRLPVPVPGSLSLTMASLRQGGLSGGLLRGISGLAPQGLVSTAPIQRTIHGATAGEPHWPTHLQCWVVACDYHTGERVVFGREGAPEADLAEAVAASCAIPGFFEPVRINGRQYVDGGLHSMSNLDLLAGEDLDLVIVFNPLSYRGAVRGWNPMDRVAAAVRRLAAWQLDNEVTQLLDRGTHVVVLEPTEEDVAAMGLNVMDASRSIEVVQTAMRTITAQLRSPEVSDLLKLLPAARGRARRASFLGHLVRAARLPVAAAF